jgi:hypothetical protein
MVCGFTSLIYVLGYTLKHLLRHLRQSELTEVEERGTGALVFGDEFVPMAIGIFVSGCHNGVELNEGVA